MSLRERLCPVCESNAPIPIYDNTMAPIGGLDMSYRVARCGSCGFSYADRLPPTARYAEYYRALSKYDQFASTAAIPEVDRIRAQAVVDFCMPYLSAQAGIADLGCGSGLLLSAFRDAGMQAVHGLDPAPGAAQRAKQLFGLDSVRTGMLSDAAELLPLQSIGLVCLTGVLEHLPDLRGDLARLLASLAPGTRVLVEVPALERFRREPFEPFGEFSLEHIQYFSVDSLVRLFASLGARCDRIRLLDLTHGASDSLLALFEAGEAPQALPPSPTETFMEDYIAASRERMTSALHALDALTGDFVIYGAGSHTARLLPLLVEHGLSGSVKALVDGNANLWGQAVGPWTVEPPDAISAHPGRAILISSFRAQKAIGAMLAGRYANPQVCLYREH